MAHRSLCRKSSERHLEWAWQCALTPDMVGPEHFCRIPKGLSHPVLHLRLPWGLNLDCPPVVITKTEDEGSSNRIPAQMGERSRAVRVLRSSSKEWSAMTSHIIYPGLKRGFVLNWTMDVRRAL